MGLRQRLQDVTSTGPKPPQREDAEVYEGGITAQDIVNQERMAAEESPECPSEAAGHKLVGPETVAPRTEEELQRHIDLSPEMIKSMARDPPPPEHKKTTGFTAANTNVALLEAFRILAGPEQLAVLSNIVLTEAGVVAKQAISPEGRKATRLSAQEAFVGSYDAAERKWQEWYKSIPGSARYFAALAGSFAAVFIVGLFLAVWRFVLFGLK